MSKAIKGFFSKVRQNYDIAKKLTGTFNLGSRIIPSKTATNDASYQLRLDAGELIDKRYQKIVLQVNSQAKSTGLREWLKKQRRGTHANLATALFDTLAEDIDAEADRVVFDLEQQAKKNLS